MLLAFKIFIEVVAIAVVTAFATPFLFGFAAVFFNSLAAGYTAGTLVVCVGLFAVGYIIVKGICCACGGTEEQSGDGKCDEP